MNAFSELTAELYRNKIAPSEVTYTYTYLKSYMSGAKVIDLGCATGSYLSLLGKPSVGVDYSEPNIRRCLAKNLTVVRADLNHPLPFRDQEFDVVFSSHTIEHLDSPLSFLREGRRVVKKGGIVIIGAPIEKTIVRLVKEDYFRGHRGHIYGISLENMIRLFLFANLKPERFFFNLPFIRYVQPLDLFLQNRQWTFLQYFATMFWLVGRKAE